MTPAGASFGDYQVLRPLDPEGGMGRHAFLAVRRSAARSGGERLRIVKLLYADARERAALLEMLPRLSRLKHPATAAVIEHLEIDGALAVVFDYLEGLRLTQVLAHLERERERLADPAIWYIAHQLLGALAEAHASSDGPLVHGHLRPDMVHLGWDGTVRLVGMGLPTLFEADLAGFGARPYRAPELARRFEKPSPPSDVYALAAILWSLLTGTRPPLDGSPIPPLGEHRDDLPKVLVEAIDEALEPISLRRTIGCRDIQERLEEALNVAPEPAELRWNMELLRAASQFATGPSFGLSGTPDSVTATSQPVSSLPPLHTLSDEPTADDATRIREGLPLSEPDELEQTLPTEGPRHDDDAPTAMFKSPLAESAEHKAPPPLPAAPAAPTPAPAPAPVVAPSPPPPQWAESAAPPTAPAPRGLGYPAAAIGALAIAATGFGLGWIVKPAASPRPAAAEPAIVASARPAPPVPTGAPPAASAEAVAAAETASASAGAGELPPVSGEADESTLIVGEGFLIVRSPVEAEVYVQGVKRGMTNTPIKTQCQFRNIRLRKDGAWITAGEPIDVACKRTTVITIRP